MVPFSTTLNDPNPGYPAFKDTPLHVLNVGNWTKFSMTPSLRSVARPLCDSWISFLEVNSFNRLLLRQYAMCRCTVVLPWNMKCFFITFRPSGVASCWRLGSEGGMGYRSPPAGSRGRARVGVWGRSPQKPNQYANLIGTNLHIKLFAHFTFLVCIHNTD